MLRFGILNALMLSDVMLRVIAVSVMLSAVIFRYTEWHGLEGTLS